MLKGRLSNSTRQTVDAQPLTQGSVRPSRTQTNQNHTFSISAEVVPAHLKGPEMPNQVRRVYLQKDVVTTFSTKLDVGNLGSFGDEDALLLPSKMITYTTLYQLSSNGQVIKYHRAVLPFLCCSLNGKLRDWYRYLSTLKISLHATILHIDKLKVCKDRDTSLTVCHGHHQLLPQGGEEIWTRGNGMQDGTDMDSILSSPSQPHLGHSDNESGVPMMGADRSSNTQRHGQGDSDNESRAPGPENLGDDQEVYLHRTFPSNTQDIRALLAVVTNTALWACVSRGVKVGYVPALTYMGFVAVR